jgi:hypothetical protein
VGGEGEGFVEVEEAVHGVWVWGALYFVILGALRWGGPTTQGSCSRIAPKYEIPMKPAYTSSLFCDRRVKMIHLPSITDLKLCESALCVVRASWDSRGFVFSVDISQGVVSCLF